MFPYSDENFQSNTFTSKTRPSRLTFPSRNLPLEIRRMHPLSQRSHSPKFLRAGSGGFSAHTSREEISYAHLSVNTITSEQDLNSRHCSKSSTNMVPFQASRDCEPIILDLY